MTPRLRPAKWKVANASDPLTAELGNAERIHVEERGTGLFGADEHSPTQLARGWRVTPTIDCEPLVRGHEDIDAIVLLRRKAVEMHAGGHPLLLKFISD